MQGGISLRCLKKLIFDPERDVFYQPVLIGVLSESVIDHAIRKLEHLDKIFATYVQQQALIVCCDYRESFQKGHPLNKKEVHAAVIKYVDGELLYFDTINDRVINCTKEPKYFADFMKRQEYIEIYEFEGVRSDHPITH